MNEIREKKRLEVKQANSSESQVNESIIEICLSFSCCYIHPIEELFLSSFSIVISSFLILLH